jgi:hypothetical protein
MGSSVYIASVEGSTGKSTVALGVLQQLSRRAERVAVFRPIVRPDTAMHGGRDYVLDLLTAHDAVQLAYDYCLGVTYDELHADPDAVLVVGSDYTDVGSPTEFSYNAKIAANLGTPVLLVLNGFQHSPRDLRAIADIAISSATTAVAFGIEPRVAMLSYSTGTSGAGTDVEKVSKATAIIRERAPELPVEGPIQYDAAIDSAVARTKLPGSPVAGRATVFVFPDLNTGNNTYKAVQRSANAVAVGPVLQGLRKPVNDLSRGATVRDIINTVAITAVQAQLGDR